VNGREIEPPLGGENTLRFLIGLGFAVIVLLVGCTPGTDDTVESTPSATPAGQSLSEIGATATAKLATETAEAPTPTAEPAQVTDTPAEASIEATEEIIATPSTDNLETPDTTEVITDTQTISGTAALVDEAAPPEEEGSTLPTSNQDAPHVNGVPIETIVVMPEEVQEHVREIYAQGRLRGRDGNAFSKLGDSLIATPSFFTQFDAGVYNLGPYEYLQPAIDYFSGSYERYGVALRPGLHAWGVFDPLWANKDWCQPNETMIACEFRLNNPGLLLILLGTNDAGSPGNFAYNIRKVVEFCIENGVIPVLVTKADRFEGPENTNNNLLREIAAEYSIPLWDYDLAAGTMPDRGLQEDQVHLTLFVENDYTMPEAFDTGHGVHNLTGLMMLDAIRQAVTSE